MDNRSRKADIAYCCFKLWAQCISPLLSPNWPHGNFQAAPSTDIGCVVNTSAPHALVCSFSLSLSPCLPDPFVPCIFRPRPNAHTTRPSGIRRSTHRPSSTSVSATQDAVVQPPNLVKAAAASGTAPVDQHRRVHLHETCRLVMRYRCSVWFVSNRHTFCCISEFYGLALRRQLMQSIPVAQR